MGVREFDFGHVAVQFCGESSANFAFFRGKIHRHSLGFRHAGIALQRGDIACHPLSGLSLGHVAYKTIGEMSCVTIVPIEHFGKPFVAHRVEESLILFGIGSTGGEQQSTN